MFMVKSLGMRFSTADRISWLLSEGNLVLLQAFPSFPSFEGIPSLPSPEVHCLFH